MIQTECRLSWRAADVRDVCSVMETVHGVCKINIVLGIIVLCVLYIVGPGLLHRHAAQSREPSKAGRDHRLQAEHLQREGETLPLPVVPVTLTVPDKGDFHQI